MTRAAGYGVGGYDIKAAIQSESETETGYQRVYSDGFEL